MHWHLRGCGKQDWLLHPFRVLRGEPVLHLCESLGTCSFRFSYPLEMTRSHTEFHRHKYWWSLGGQLENLRSDLLLGLKTPREGCSMASVLRSRLLSERADVNDWRTHPITFGPRLRSITSPGTQRACGPARQSTTTTGCALTPRVICRCSSL